MKLLVDATCGKLARYLRMCGHDAAYVIDRGLEGDEAILAAAEAEGRRLVTRDGQLARRADDAMLVRARDVLEQLRELREAGFELSLTRPERCGRCNGLLDPVDPAASTPEYAPDPGETAVWRCTECGQHFWRGSHWDDVADRLAGLEE